MPLDQDLNQDGAQEQQEQTKEQNNQTAGGNNQQGLAGGFEVTGLGLFGNNYQYNFSNQGDLENFVKGANETIASIEKMQPGAKFSIIQLDRQVHTNLDYSFVIIALQSGKAVYTFKALLSSTGEDRGSVTSYLSEMEIAFNSRQRPNELNLATTGDFIVPVIDSIVKQILETQDQFKGKAITPIDGFVVPKMLEADMVEVGRKVSSLIATYLLAEVALENPENDINIQKHVAGKNLQNNITLSGKAPVADYFGRPVRSDFSVILNANDMSNNINQMHSSNGNKKLSQVHGYLDFIADVDRPQVPYGQLPVEKNVFRPNIVLTKLETVAPSTTAALLSIATLGVVLNPNFVFTKVKENLSNIGALNIFTNIEGDKSRIGAPLDLTSKKVTTQQVDEFILQMIPNMSPTLSMDVELRSDASPILSAFAALSGGHVDAGRYIISKASALTGGIFPANFDVNKIILPGDVTVPLSSFVDGNVMKDSRELDMASTLTMTKDPTKVYSYQESVLPAQQGKNNYTTRMGDISKILQCQEVHTKAKRIALHPEFLTALIQSVISAGLAMNFDAASLMNAQGNQQQIVNPFSNGQVTGGVDALYANPYNRGNNMGGADSFNPYYRF